MGFGLKPQLMNARLRLGAGDQLRLATFSHKSKSIKRTFGLFYPDAMHRMGIISGVLKLFSAILKSWNTVVGLYGAYRLIRNVLIIPRVWTYTPQ